MSPLRNGPSSKTFYVCDEYCRNIVEQVWSWTLANYCCKSFKALVPMLNILRHSARQQSEDRRSRQSSRHFQTLFSWSYMIKLYRIDNQNNMQMVSENKIYSESYIPTSFISMLHVKQYQYSLFTFQLNQCHENKSV